MDDRSACCEETIIKFCCELIIYLYCQPSFNRTTILKQIAESAPPTKYDTQLHNKKPHNVSVANWQNKK